MAPAALSLLPLLVVVLLALPAAAVTTPRDVRRALDAVATYQGNPDDLASFSAPLAEKLQVLRKRARDFAFGSVLEASRTAREREGLVARARQRVKVAGMPYIASAAWMREQFSPSVRIEFFALPDSPEWMGARVEVGIPCGEDISLYLWRLSAEEGSELLVPELMFARESALTDLASSTGTLHYALHANGDGAGLELAAIETGVWCNSQWRKAILSVVRRTGHAFRSERLFQYQEMVFLGAEPAPRVERMESGYRFRYLAHFWLDPLQLSRLKELEVNVLGDRAELLPPREEDPALFLDHWLAAPWVTSRSWTTGQHQYALRNWHDMLSPDGTARTVAEVRGRGGCKSDPTAYYVHLHTAQGGGSQDVYGILRRVPEGLRIEQIREQLPPGCEASTTPDRKAN